MSDESSGIISDDSITSLEWCHAHLDQHGYFHTHSGVIRTNLVLFGTSVPKTEAQSQPSGL